ncbi:glycosyltransferase family 2 protein [Clostridium sp. FP2]|uniref:glycosyltransferase family 2 protein n=1 Tax=Clostridium sp. FP2 TaxID=2724481 RepID=UPI0013E956DC|nr:glycosyltransferase family 2 protein [Clostridium sp. FP2]MBZ9625180.1 glycosyltransferase family 2 protein [Clostridium sp. FP2]
MENSYIQNTKLILIKIKRILSNKCFKHHKLNNPKLYMTLLIKNEEDIIEENLIFHKSMGVDGFIVTDNNSTDKTKEIIEKYYKLGWIKQIIYEKGKDHSQAIWVDRMIKLATEKYNADWVINADADEFWYSKNKNLKTELRGTNTNVLKCNIYNILPSETKLFYDGIFMVKKPIDKIEEFNLSKFNMYTKQIAKVIHRTKGYKQISPGNHGVKMKLKSEKKSSDIIIFHYNIRGLEHFKSKMINGGKAFEENLILDKNIGKHWRYYYEGWKSGKLDLDEEYNKTIALQFRELFLKQGIIIENRNVKTYLENILK